MCYNCEMQERTFASRLKSVRSTLGLSQTEFAKKLGISAHAYLNYETGKVQPQVGLLQKLRELFGMNANWLLDGSGSMFVSIEFNEAIMSDSRAVELLTWINKSPAVLYNALTSFEVFRERNADIFEEEGGGDSLAAGGDKGEKDADDIIKKNKRGIK